MSNKYNSIGLVGYAGSGKDTTAALLQIELLKNADQFSLYAFADPLKKFITDVFGVEKERLYDQKLKEQTINFKISEIELFVKFTNSFIELLDVHAENNNATIYQTINRFNEGYDGAEFIERMYTQFKEVIKSEQKKVGFFKWMFSDGKIQFETTPRRLAQIIGTEFFRDCVSSPFWSDIAPKENVIYTDVRFPEEAECVRANGGILVKIINENQRDISSIDHASERFISQMDVDDIIVNSGVNIGDLVTAVEQFVERHKESADE
jgi:hypothetical protein